MKSHRYLLFCFALGAIFSSGFIPQPNTTKASPSLQTSPGEPSPTFQRLTYVGTDKWDNSFATDQDANGNIYMLTNSYESDDGSFNTTKDDNQMAITKLTTNGQVEWKTIVNSELHSWGTYLVTDSEGNVFIAGASNTTWGNPISQFVNDSGKNMFLAKYGRDGALLWNTFIGTNVDTLTNIVEVGEDGNIIIAWAQGNDNDTNSFFLANLNASGELQWTKMYVVVNEQRDGYLGGAYDIDIDDQGNIYLLCYGISDWGTPIRNPSGDLDGSLAKFDRNGSLIWNTFLGGIGQDFVFNMERNQDGSIYVTGTSETEWGTPINPLRGNTDGFVANIGSDGKLLWNTFMGGESGDDSALDVTTDSEGNLFVVGYSDSSWGSPFNASTGNGDGFLAQLDSNGSLVWNTFIGGTGSENIEWVEVRDNIVYIMGLSDSIFGNPISGPKGGGNDLYVAAISLKNGSSNYRDPGPLVPELTRYIPTPLDISTDPSVIGTNILLAVFLMLPFAVAVDYFSKLVSENEETLRKRIPPLAWIHSLQGRLSSLIPGGSGVRQTLMDVLSLLGVAVLYGIIFSLLDITWNPFSASGLVLLGSMTLAYGMIGFLDDILQWLAVRKWGIPTEYNVRPTNILLSVISVGVSRAFSLLPGLMFGSPEALHFDESLLNKKQNQTLIRMSTAIYLLITFGAWLPTIVTTLIQRSAAPDTVKELVGGLEAFLLVIFAVGLENIFLDLLGFSDGLGMKIKQTNGWIWSLSLALCTFLFLHTLLNPQYDFVDVLQQGNISVFIGIAVAFILITGLLRFISWRRERKAKAETTESTQ